MKLTSNCTTSIAFVLLCFSFLLVGCENTEDTLIEANDGETPVSEMPEEDVPDDTTPEEEPDMGAIGPRDPLKWPFLKTSIWNMPLGSDAVYKDANFEPAGNVGVDTQHIIILSDDDPTYPVWNSPSFQANRCSGTDYLGFDLKFPKDLIIADAGSSPYGLTPNSNYAILDPSDQMMVEGSRISRCIADGPIHLPEWKRFENNRTRISYLGDGLEGAGGQGASHLSALGGTIRLGELVGDEPIRHVIKINPWAEKYLHYSDEVPGFKWPAQSADNYAPTIYNRNADPDIVMGSLFAIPRDVTAEDLGLETEAAKKLLYTLQHYGTYFTEDTYWDTWDLIVEEYVAREFEEAYGFGMESDLWKAEINKLMTALHVITNNTENTIGGGGEPVAPLAPDF
ncbi:hypothetical protein [Maribacter sp. 2307ULW6-5]|uniref:hypothetical protein n=1 Tax=Maribacter sp. 2307ULW6-5 TaxID=3386275 RepID=UPI0039BC39C4